MAVSARQFRWFGHSIYVTCEGTKPQVMDIGSASPRSSSRTSYEAGALPKPGDLIATNIAPVGQCAL
jgi:hypothetical protein